MTPGAKGLAQLNGFIPGASPNEVHYRPSHVEQVPPVFAALRQATVPYVLQPRHLAAHAIALSPLPSTTDLDSPVEGLLCIPLTRKAPLYLS
jgi:hypothetical protein